MGHFFAMPRFKVWLGIFIDPGSSLESRIRYLLHHDDDES